jgi:hypothetical protein
MLIMEELEKQMVDKLVAILNEFIDDAPVELHCNKEHTYLFIPLNLISLSRIGIFRGYRISPSPYSNKIILSDLMNYYVIEKTI